MNASVEAISQGARRWLLLIHQLPHRPDYVRVKVRRRLHRLGAVMLKNSVYVLPETEGAIEDLQWLSNEIAADGGNATICSAAVLSGVSDEELIALFRTERDADYAEIAKDARLAGRGSAGASEELVRLRRRLEAVRLVDFFGSTEKRDAESAIDALRSAADPEIEQRDEPASAQHPDGATWVTRSDVFIDRIASAWLIRRFIDAQARFKFVANDYRKKAGELRFDMYRGEYTHVGDRCTFETLLSAFGLSEPALTGIAEVVHDLDYKDDKFGRPEALGIGAAMRGIALSTTDDSQRIERGAPVFNGLYEVLRTPG